jgi:hypothetical protein
MLGARHTPKAGGKVGKKQLTQVGRAPAQCGITYIPSYSPQARGRMERVFGTLQNRLPQELQLHRFKTVAPAANRYLKRQFMADYNERFTGAAAEPALVFRPYVRRPLADILCVPKDRRVGGDNCVIWRWRSLQIALQAHRPHDVKATVRVTRKFRWHVCHLRWTALSGAIRSTRTTTARCLLAARLTPLGASGLWICGQRSVLPKSSTGITATAEADK